eukprot:Hpha_TRINITY_DN19256_c0_g1::TRINITY_DN19256_c0_g1_i1::g.194332::m.194332
MGTPPRRQSSPAPLSLPPAVCAILDANEELREHGDVYGRGDFDPIEHLNECMPTADAMRARSSGWLEAVDTKLALCDIEMAEAVGGPGAGSPEQAEASLRAAQEMLRELLGEVGDLKGAMDRSDKMVTEVCREISELDAARGSLSTAVETLEAARRVGSALDGVDEAATEGDLGRAAGHLQIASKLLTTKLTRHTG